MTTATEHSNQFKAQFKDFRIGIMDGRVVMLRVPSFDCGWYWGFGYLGNSHCHFHLDHLESMDPKLANENLYDQLIGLFGDSLTIPREKLWTFCEIVKTVYTLKEAAEVFGRGGSHYTKNPDKDALTIPEYVDRINNELIPMQIRSLWELLTVDNKK